MTATERIRRASSPEDYRTGFYLLAGIVKIEVLIVFCLMAANVYMSMTYRPQDNYYAVNFENKMRYLYGLDSPILNQDALLSWVSNAATDIMTFGFADYDERLYATRVYFTPEGWIKFAPAIMGSRLLSSVIEKRQIMVAIPLEPPTILSEGVVRGRYTYQVRAPMLLSIRAGNAKTSSTITADLEIVRMPTSEMPSGLGISLWRSM